MACTPQSSGWKIKAKWLDFGAIMVNSYDTVWHAVMGSYAAIDTIWHAMTRSHLFGEN